MRWKEREKSRKTIKICRVYLLLAHIHTKNHFYSVQQENRTHSLGLAVCWHLEYFWNKTTTQYSTTLLYCESWSWSSSSSCRSWSHQHFLRGKYVGRLLMHFKGTILQLDKKNVQDQKRGTGSLYVLSQTL